MLQKFLLLLATAAFAFGPAAMSGDESSIHQLSDLNGKRLGVLAGTMLDAAANDALDFTQFEYYDNNEQLFQALYDGEIDATVDDQPVARFRAGINPRLRMLPEMLVDDNYAFALRLEDVKLYHEVNRTLNEIRTSDEMDRLETKWLDSPDDSQRVLPDMPAQGDGEVLRVGVSSVSPPFCYLDNEGDLTGLDIELMQMVAAKLGRRLELTDMEFAQMIPALLEGKVDVIGGCFSITPERQRLVRFTDSYYKGGVAVLVLK